jgi:hypothetical protein
MLLIRRLGEGSWHAPEVNAYQNEEALEQLLAASPDLLPGSSAGPMVVARQVQTGAGPADLIGISLDGSVLLVECKLRANPEIRRAVVGQLFAYASALWKMPVEEFERAVAARLGRVLAGDEAWDEGSFRANLARTLLEGRFRLVIAVDLNEHTIGEVEIVALEIGYLSDEGVEIVLPKTYGTEAVRAKAAGRAPIGEPELFNALGNTCSAEGVAAIRALFDWVVPHGGSFAWGYGDVYPSTTAGSTSRGSGLPCGPRLLTPRDILQLVGGKLDVPLGRGTRSESLRDRDGAGSHGRGASIRGTSRGRASRVDRAREDCAGARNPLSTSGGPGTGSGIYAAHAASGDVGRPGSGGRPRHDRQGVGRRRQSVRSVQQA